MNISNYKSKKDIYKIKVAICIMLFVSCSIWLFNGVIRMEKDYSRSYGNWIINTFYKKDNNIKILFYMVAVSRGHFI